MRPSLARNPSPQRLKSSNVPECSKSLVAWLSVALAVSLSRRRLAAKCARYCLKTKSRQKKILRYRAKVDFDFLDAAGLQTRPILTFNPFIQLPIVVAATRRECSLQS